MSLLQAYLRNPKTQRVLSRKPGDKGFSLIELVVVVAVLAILAAIAIPSFTSINDKAKASAAANTLAQIAKECAVKDANNELGAFTLPNLSDYVFTPAATTAAPENCEGNASGEIVATSSNTSKFPTFIYNVNTGVKSCAYATSISTALHGCSSATGGTW